MSQTESYRDSHSTEGKGAQYDSYYENDPWQAFMWRREQACIDDLLKEHLGGRDIRLLDFACGSGRITRFLETRVANCVGVDVSESMLEIARAKLQQTELVNADLTRESPIAERKFDLITAFRFFTNAEDELRESVMQALPSYLAEDGYVLFNNHHIPESMYYRAQRMVARLRGRPQGTSVRMMSMNETLDLMQRAGLARSQSVTLAFFICPD
jgi:predicted TPR repeat methyltransferase